LPIEPHVRDDREAQRPFSRHRSPAVLAEVIGTQLVILNAGGHVPMYGGGRREQDAGLVQGSVETAALRSGHPRTPAHRASYSQEMARRYSTACQLSTVF